MVQRGGGFFFFYHILVGFFFFSWLVGDQSEWRRSCGDLEEVRRVFVGLGLVSGGHSQ